jgi:hypothetical protein
MFIVIHAPPGGASSAAVPVAAAFKTQGPELPEQLAGLAGSGTVNGE